jgi:hypothetical protein
MLQEAYEQVRLYSLISSWTISNPNGKRIGSTVPQLPARRVGWRIMAAHRPGFKWYGSGTLVNRCVVAYHAHRQDDKCG